MKTAKVKVEMVEEFIEAEKTLAPDPYEGKVKQYAKAYKRFDKKVSKKVNESDLPGSNGKEEPLIMGFDQRDAMIEAPRKSKRMVKHLADIVVRSETYKGKSHFKRIDPSDKK